MSEAFTAITFEVYISSAWVDISDDVLDDPPPHCTRGIQGNGYADRVADPGTLTFSLNNSTSNSAGLLGYYSPGHANCLSGWATSLPVRLKFTYDTWTYVKWYGRIEPDGIKVDPGSIGTRRVNVSCTDFMGLASNHKLNLIPPQVNLDIQEAMDLLTNNMAIQPLDTDYQTAFSADFPYLFDVMTTDTTALGEFQKLAVSFRGSDGSPGASYIVVRGGGDGGEILTATFTSPDQRYLPTTTANSVHLLAETGVNLLSEAGGILLCEGGDSVTAQSANDRPNFTDSDILPDSDFCYGRDITNAVTVVSYPRRVDAAATTVLWTMDKPISLDPGASTTIRGAYNNPTGGAKINGANFVTPVSGTDWKANASSDGTGLDRTSDSTVTAEFGNAEVELTITNTSGVNTIYIGGGTAGAFLQVRGKGVYIEDTARQVTKDAASIATHGERPLTIDSKYMDLTVNFSVDISYGQGILNSWKTPQVAIDKLALLANKDIKNMVHFLFLEPRDYIAITEAMNGLSAAVYYIQGYDFTIVDGKLVFWSLNLKIE